MKTTIPSESPSTTRAARATSQTTNNDVEEGEDAVENGKDDESNAMHDAHEHAADGLEDAFELDVELVRTCAGLSGKTYAGDYGAHFDARFA